jgi:hypothetical protein
MGAPFGRDFENARAGLAFHDAGMDCLETGGMERLRCVKHELFRSATALLEGGIVFKKSGAFDYVNNQDFTSLRTQLRCQNLSGRVGKLRTVDSQKYFHVDSFSCRNTEFVIDNARRAKGSYCPSRSGGKRRIASVLGSGCGPVYPQTQAVLDVLALPIS